MLLGLGHNFIYEQNQKGRFDSFPPPQRMTFLQTTLPYIPSHMGVHPN